MLEKLREARHQLTAVIMDDRVKVVLDEVKPLVLAQDFARVCEKLEAESEIAANEERLADAASLSTMLGSFRSITGDEEAALRALERAETLEPNNPHRLVSTAHHLFTRMNRNDDAARRINAALKRELDHATKHEALALLGRVAVREDRIDDAIALLAEARDLAVDGNVEPMLWDRSLARDLACEGRAPEAARSYATLLIERAEAEDDDATRREALKIINSTIGD